MNPQKIFTGIHALIYRASGGAIAGRMFGAPVLKVQGKVLAMLVKGRLVVKLPRPRVDDLIASRLGEPFDPGHGKPSKEWVAVEATASNRWRRLLDEAREFVAPIG